MQRFNGGKRENGRISQGQGKERQLSGAKTDTQGDKQPLNKQEAKVRILESEEEDGVLFVLTSAFLDCRQKMTSLWDLG